MLDMSQPLDPKVSKKMGLDSKKNAVNTKRTVLSEHMGGFFDDLLDGIGKDKISIKTRLGWFVRRIKGTYHDARYVVRNHIKWRKTISSLRPWEGFDGMLNVMITHLRDYIRTEEKYGHSEATYKKRKVAAAKETVKILRRMKDPSNYSTKRRKEVDKRYPKYKSLITDFSDGSTGSSGDFEPQGNGWAGRESGKDPREGYFEFVNGRLEQKASPDQTETDRILARIALYYEEVSNAYKQAEADSERDFKRLNYLLQNYMYRWWD